MKVRLVSDLHIDVNQWDKFGFMNKLDKTDLLLIAGDIAGDYQNEIKWLDSLKENNTNCKVVIVGGNHLGYNYTMRTNRIQNPLDGTKEFSINKLTSTYNSNNFHYLENDYIKYKDKIIFGGTMYSDFALYGTPMPYGRYAERYMNDFRYVHTLDLYEELVRPVTYEDYIHWFNIFISKLQNCITDTALTGEDIIVLTHFAPSGKSISTKYSAGVYRDLNPAYASNLVGFIKDNPRIKYWCHGHMHDSFKYQIAQCKVLCKPFGYMHENKISPQCYNGKKFEV